MRLNREMSRDEVAEKVDGHISSWMSRGAKLWQPKITLQFDGPSCPSQEEAERWLNRSVEELKDIIGEDHMPVFEGDQFEFEEPEETVEVEETEEVEDIPTMSKVDGSMRRSDLDEIAKKLDIDPSEFSRRDDLAKAINEIIGGE